MTNRLNASPDAVVVGVVLAVALFLATVDTGVLLVENATLWAQGATETLLASVPPGAVDDPGTVARANGTATDALGAVESE